MKQRNCLYRYWSKMFNVVSAFELSVATAATLQQNACNQIFFCYIDDMYIITSESDFLKWTLSGTFFLYCCVSKPEMATGYAERCV